MNISIMLKPASSNCNLRCKYCFYNDLSSHREMPSHGMMSEKTLRSTLKKAFDFAGHDRVMLSFQGGEPLLAGKEFFLKLHDIIRELNVNRAPVSIGVQTNGTLIDDEWCRIFKRGGYLVGLSLDGDEVADSLRIDANGNPTFSRALNGAKLMQKYGVDFNILVVLTKQVANRIEPIYKFFKKQNFKHLQFIPMLKPLRVDESGKPISKTTYNECFPSEQENYSMSAEDYSEFCKSALRCISKTVWTANTPQSANLTTSCALRISSVPNSAVWKGIAVINSSSKGTARSIRATFIASIATIWATSTVPISLRCQSIPLQPNS